MNMKNLARAFAVWDNLRDGNIHTLDTTSPISI